MKRWQIFSLSIFALLAVATVIFILVPQLSVGLIELECGQEGCADQSAIQIALSLGRLDVIALCLALLGIGLAFFAVFSFFAIKESADNVAKSEAYKTATNVANQRLDWLEGKLDMKVERKVKEHMNGSQVKAGQDDDTSGALEMPE